MSGHGVLSWRWYHNRVVMLVVICNIQRLYSTVVTWWQILLKTLICNSSLRNYASGSYSSYRRFSWRNVPINCGKFVIDWIYLIFGSVGMWNTVDDLVLVSYLLTYVQPIFHDWSSVAFLSWSWIVIDLTFTHLIVCVSALSQVL